MKLPQQGQRIVWFVRVLTVIGFAIVVTTTGLVGWTLAKVRAERARVTAVQERLDLASQELREHAANGRAEIQNIFDETIAQRTNQQSAAGKLDELIHSQFNSHPDPAVLPALVQFRTQVSLVTDLETRAKAWRAIYTPVWEDIRGQKTMGEVRQIITQLRTAVETLEGRRRLDEAIRYKRWRGAVGAEAYQQAQSILSEHARQQSEGANDFKSELAECARLVELLGGEEQLDNLADLKDNRLTPILDRLSRTVATFRLEQAGPDALPPQSIEKLKAVLFGAATPVALGGLLKLRHDVLQLRRERESLKKELASSFQAIEAANADFAQSTQILTTALTQQMERSLGSGWRQLLIFGGCSSALFFWLAWMISRGIKGQVNTIESARAEAESGRQTTHKLMLEQQAAAAELAAAHKEVQASKQLQELIFNAVGEGIQWIDREGRIIFENPTAARLLGWEPAELIGRISHPTMHHTRADGSPYPRCECHIYAGLRDGLERHVDDEVFWRKDGTSFPVEYTSTPVRDGNGEIAGAVVVFADITERKRAETELMTVHQGLQASEQRFRALSASAPIGIFLTDAAGLSLYTNPHWQSLTGMSLEKSLGYGWVQAIHPEDAARVSADWKSAAGAGREFKRQFRFCTANGEVRWVHVQSAAIRSETGEVTGHVGTVENITERKRAEEELAKTQRELLEISRMAGMAEVATGVLHNVGNVLNSVNVSSTLVADAVRKSKATNLAKVVQLLRAHEADLGHFFTSDPKGKQLPDYLAQLSEHLAVEQAGALEEITRLQKNIEHIKDIVSKQQSYAVVSGVAETVKVSDLVEDALHLNGGSLARHDIEAVREFSEVPPISVEKHKVLQILVNLIRNAKHACDDSGRAHKRVTVRVTNGAGSIKISISDNGVGIPPENLIRIFNHGFTTRAKGHGFGLHSGALAAKQLGGELRVHSDGVGRGATFTLELPLESSGGGHG